MKTIRFRHYGEPGAVLVLEEAAVPEPQPGHIRIRVHACGLNPADWALCRGLFAGDLPRGIGLEASGHVEAIGEGVGGLSVGDAVFGAVDFAGYASAGASDRAILNNWAKVPPGLDLPAAAALPMAVETACRCLDSLGIASGQTLFINGAGTTVGFAAVQIALQRGVEVIATAGETFAAQLRGFGAKVTAYGEGMVGRVRGLAAGAPDLVLDTAPPVAGVLELLVEIAGDPQRILTITDFEGAKRLGLRQTGADANAVRYHVLDEFARLAAEQKFTIPVARTFALEDWRAALDLSLGGHPHGKLLLLPGGASGAEG